MATRQSRKWMVFLLLGALSMGDFGLTHFRQAQAATLSIDLQTWTAKIHAGWTGKVAAGSGALLTEMWPKERIQDEFGVLNGPPQSPTSRGPLDDTTLSVLGWHTAQERGAGFTSADIAREWRDHLVDADLKGGGFGKEFLSVLSRLRSGAIPPVPADPIRAEWIAAQMRAEIWGMLAPGDPARASGYASRDASVFNVGNGVNAAQFVAALASQLMVAPDIPQAIDVARRQIPADSKLGRLIGDTIRWHEQYPNDWETTWHVFVDAYRDRAMDEELAAWSPDWLVETSGWPEADIVTEYLGRKSVLRTHPFSEDEPARITTEVTVPAEGGRLTVWTTCNDLPANVDWLLRVRIGDEVKEEPIRWIGGVPQWQEYVFDLKPWAGREVIIVLENAVLGKQAWEAGFWTAPEFRDAQGHVFHARRPTGRAHRYPLEFAPRILPETFSVLTGLLYGNGDFRRSVSLATMCGFDTDCNAGTVGCLLGVRNGLEAIPEEWKAPLKDTYELQVSGLPRQWKIAELARQMAETGAKLASGEQQPRGDGLSPAAAASTSATLAAHQKLAVPSDPPEGFGAASKGGEGGRLIAVTTLADSGPGSLREALEAQGPRIIVFSVEGTIKLQTRLRCTSGRVTIDGGSAPGQGVTLLNHGIQFRGDCDDIIVRNVRIRVLTGGAEGDCLLVWGHEGGTVERVLVDHCSLMWATDEVMNTWGQVRDLTCQWTILAEAQLPHSKGWLSGMGSDRISIHHCLFAHNADRTPKLEGGTYDLVNNVIYNWGNNNGTKIESGARVNLINNCFLRGPDSAAQAGFVFPADPDKGTKVFLSGNTGPYSPSDVGDQWANVRWYEQAGGRWVERHSALETFRSVNRLPAAHVATQSAKEAYESVLARAGAKVRDTDDLRVVKDVQMRTGRVGRKLADIPTAPKPRTGKFTSMAVGDRAGTDRLEDRKAGSRSGRVKVVDE